MQVEYIFTALSKDKKATLYIETFSEKKDALKTYQKLCETSPKENFRVTKRETVEKTIAESDDYRQQKFSF